MKVYKGVSNDLTAYGGFRYEVGKTYECENPDLCHNGFHGCEAPLDVLRHYPIEDGNRYFEAELDGVTEELGSDSNRVGSKITFGAEIDLPGLIKAHAEYTRKKAVSGTVGGERSNIAGGSYSNIAGGSMSNLAGGSHSNLAGGSYSNLAVGSHSNLAGGNGSNLAGGYWSNLAGGERSNIVGGERSNIVGGKNSAIIASNGARVKGGLGSAIMIVDREYVDGKWIVKAWKAGIVDGITLKPDIWYCLKYGKFVEVQG